METMYTVYLGHEFSGAFIVMREAMEYAKRLQRDSWCEVTVNEVELDVCKPESRKVIGSDTMQGEGSMGAEELHSQQAEGAPRYFVNANGTCSRTMGKDEAKKLASKASKGGRDCYVVDSFSFHAIARFVGGKSAPFAEFSPVP